MVGVVRNVMVRSGGVRGKRIRVVMPQRDMAVALGMARVRVPSPMIAPVIAMPMHEAEQHRCDESQQADEENGFEQHGPAALGYAILVSSVEEAGNFGR